MDAELIPVLTRIADALERLANDGKATGPNLVRPMGEYAGFDWASIGAQIVQSDNDGPTHVQHGPTLYTRRSPSNKFDPAIWYSASAGKDDDGNVQYIRLITFRDFSDADPLPAKVANRATGEIKDGQPQPTPKAPAIPPAASKPEPAPADDKPMNGYARPYTPSILREKLLEISGIYLETVSKPGFKAPENLAQVVAINLNECFAGEADYETRRKALLKWLAGRDSLTNMDAAWLLALKKWLNPTKDSGGAWKVDPMAAKEARAAYEAIAKEKKK